MATKKKSSAAGTTDSQNVPGDGLNAGGMVGDGPVIGNTEVPDVLSVKDAARAAAKVPPPSSEENGEEKKTYQGVASRPECHVCHKLMHAKSTPGISTWYYCDNEDCVNTSGRQIFRKEDIDFLEKNRNVQQQSVAARENMKDTSGE